MKELTNEEKEIFEERAAIIEYDGGLTREEAEKEAMHQIYSQLELFM